MVIVDANVLIYAVDRQAAHHDVSRHWLDGALARSGGVGLPWLVILAFTRIVTHPRIMPTPMTIDEAAVQVQDWLAAPSAIVVEPTPRHLTILSGLLRETSTGANLVNDAHIAALALEHNAPVVSFDRDFARFGGVRHELPA